jgi:hypothetical protein
MHEQFYFIRSFQTSLINVLILVPVPVDHDLEMFIGSSEQALELLRKVMLEYYPINSEADEVVIVEAPIQLPSQRQSTQSSIFDGVFESSPLDHPTLDSSLTMQEEIDTYMKDDVLGPTGSPLVYWRKNSQKFPKLSQLAKRYLAFPASSGSVERLFSIAGSIARARR